MPREDIILFLDLETTGSDVNFDEIIEVGLVMIDSTTFKERGVFQSIVLPSDAAYMRMIRKEVVRKMHEANGLLVEIQEEFTESSKDLSMGSIYAPVIVEYEIQDWLDTFTSTDATHIPYGGSGVSHFDRKFIDKYLPKLGSRITHWALDVGSTRRQAEKAGIPGLPQGKTHRALDDARFHVEEFKYYQKIWKGDA